MKIFLTESEVIELAYDALDLCQPDPDKVHSIAEKMDMVYNEELDLYEDVEEISLRAYKIRLAKIPAMVETLELAKEFIEGVQKLSKIPTPNILEVIDLAITKGKRL